MEDAFSVPFILSWWQTTQRTIEAMKSLGEIPRMPTRAEKEKHEITVRPPGWASGENEDTSLTC